MGESFICLDCGSVIMKEKIDNNAELFCPECNGRLQES